MSLTTCTLTGDNGVSTEALGYNTEPFNLQSNKFISFVYPVLSADGSEPELQLGASDRQGVVVASFNGSDYDTKAPRHDKRNLRITTDEQYTQFFEELDKRTVAIAKANKASWFPAQRQSLTMISTNCTSLLSGTPRTAKNCGASPAHGQARR